MPTTMERKRYQLRRKLNYSAIFFYTELWRIYMYAGLLRCCVVILGFIDGLLTRLQRGLGGEPSLEHVGDEYAGQLRIDEGGE